MNSARILVVDDDESMRQLLQLHLVNAGYEVIVAEDAIVAAHTLMKQPVDLVVLDIEMPYMDGVQLLRGLKGEERLCRIPVVFLTANKEVQSQAAGIGAAGFLTKPIVANRLLHEIAKHIPGAPQPID